MMSDLNMSHGKMSGFISLPLFGFTLVIKPTNFDFESHWNTLIFFDKKRYGVRFEYVPWKNVWFCFISIAWVHFSHKTVKLWFWKSLKYFSVFMIKKDLVSNLNMSYGKMPDFVLFPLFGFTLVIKQRNFDFESHWNTLIFFDKTNNVRFKYVMPNSVWFGLRFTVWVEFWQ